MGFHDQNGGYHDYRKPILFSLFDFREATTGDVGNIVANGGILASDTTPTLSGSGSTVAQVISWATGNTDQLLLDRSLPDDFDGREDALLELLVSSGTTDLASFTVLNNWDAAAADITDTATDTGASATAHWISARIAASDIPDSPKKLSLGLTPAAHATNAINLHAARLTYVARIV